MQFSKTVTRKLHYGHGVKVHLDNALAWALVNNCSDNLAKSLDYLRTYGNGPEGEWMTELRLDVPFRKEEFNFIARILKNTESGFMTYIVILMAQNKHECKWEFHT